MSLTSLALLAVAALAALGVLTVLHYAFWQWRFAAPTGEDEVVHARTRDGWTLALGRRRPRAPSRRPPVLLVHGIAMNRQALDFGVERYSLSAFLARAGFDCFALDLRGHGGSRRGPDPALGPRHLPARGPPRRARRDPRRHRRAARPLRRPQPGRAPRHGRVRPLRGA